MLSKKIKLLLKKTLINSVVRPSITVEFENLMATSQLMAISFTFVSLKILEKIKHSSVSLLSLSQTTHVLEESSSYINFHNCSFLKTSKINNCERKNLSTQPCHSAHQLFVPLFAQQLKWNNFSRFFSPFPACTGWLSFREIFHFAWFF